MLSSSFFAIFFHDFFLFFFFLKALFQNWQKLGTYFKKSKKKIPQNRNFCFAKSNSDATDCELNAPTAFLSPFHKLVSFHCRHNFMSMPPPRLKRPARTVAADLHNLWSIGEEVITRFSIGGKGILEKIWRWYNLDLTLWLTIFVRGIF